MRAAHSKGMDKWEEMRWDAWSCKSWHCVSDLMWVISCLCETQRGVRWISISTQASIVWRIPGIIAPTIGTVFSGRQQGAKKISLLNDLGTRWKQGKGGCLLEGEKGEKATSFAEQVTSASSRYNKRPLNWKLRAYALSVIGIFRMKTQRVRWSCFISNRARWDALHLVLSCSI